MSPATDRRVTVVVPTLGESPWLLRCLEALRRDGGEDLSLILVAQGPHRLRLPRGLLHPVRDRTVHLPEPMGFAAAANLGLGLALRGRTLTEEPAPWVATVNDDVVVTPGWLAALRGALEADPEAGSAQGIHLEMVQPPGLESPEGRDLDGEAWPEEAVLDGWGLGWNRWLQAVQLGHGRPLGESGAPTPEEGPRAVFGVSATAALYRREALLEVALDPEPVFDETEEEEEDGAADASEMDAEERNRDGEGNDTSGENDTAGEGDREDHPGPEDREDEDEEGNGDEGGKGDEDELDDDALDEELAQALTLVGPHARPARSREIFDSRLLSYYEDADLAVRLEAAGWRALAVPGARARHVGSSTMGRWSFRRRRLITGNRWLVLARTLGRGFWLQIPRLLLRDLLDLLGHLDRMRFREAAGVKAGWLRALVRGPRFLRWGRPLVARRELTRDLDGLDGGPGDSPGDSPGDEAPERGSPP